ncbi:MAG: serine hydrolase [Lachnospiraceae bacterium]|nr:serine hydrolase [Lachnospiraceae bacterium]
MNKITKSTRIIQGIHRLLNEKNGVFPKFHCNDAGIYISPSRAEDFPHSTPAKQGVRIEGIRSLVDVLSEDGDLNLYGFGMLVNGTIIYESYHESNIPINRHVTFSMSKSIVSMAVGIAIEQKLFSLESKLYDIFLLKGKYHVKSYMKELTIRQLLMMQSGVAFDDVVSFFEEDWKKAYFESSFLFPPGEDFAYNSLNTYILVAAIEETSGMSFSKFMDKNLFLPMNISDISWDMCPHGTAIGGYGMKLSIPDMLKFGWLFLNDGAWTTNKTTIQLVPKWWIKECKTCKVLLPEKQIIQGYSYHTWILWDGAYLFNGLFGQNIYIHPGRNLVIATNASAYELFPDGKFVSRLMSYASIDLNFRKTYLCLPDRSIANIFQKNYSKQERKILRKMIDVEGRDFFFNNNQVSFVPLFTQVLYSNYMTGIQRIRFHVRNCNIYMYIHDSGEEYVVKLGYGSTPYIQQTLVINGKEYRISTGCNYVSEGMYAGMIKIKFIYPEEVSSKCMYISLKKDTLHVHIEEQPSIVRLISALNNERKLYNIKKRGHALMPEVIIRKLIKRMDTDIVSR